MAAQKLKMRFADKEFVRTDMTEDDTAAQEGLRKAIEGLSESYPMFSRSARTHRSTSHVVFSNGVIAKEGIPVEWWFGEAKECAEATFVAVREYRDSIPGPVQLVWRDEVEIQRSTLGVKIRVRLCFEPALRPHAKLKGVWVEFGADPCGED
jgi:hypothetical protein